MKKLVVILLLCISFIGFSQEVNERKKDSVTIKDGVITKNIGDFPVVKVYDLIEVIMIKTLEENKVEISGKNASDVSVVNKNGKLKIRMDLEEIFDGNDTKVTLYYTSIETIDVNEGAKVLIEDTIKQFEIDLKAQEGGKISGDIETTFAYIRAVTGGEINLTGEVKNQDISIYTAGKYFGEACESKNSDISIHAAGVAHVYATGRMDIRIRAGGDVYVYGKPKNIDESRVFGGRIFRKD